MANRTNDDMDRIGNRNTPQGSTSQTPQDPSQGRDSMNRDRGMEEGRNITNQGRTPDESFNRDTSDRGPGNSGRESESRGNEFERDKGGRGPSDISE